MLRKAEWAAAALLSLTVLCLHLVATTSAGALWRDEAQTVAVSTLPRLRDVWATLQYESFPILWLMIVRGFSALFGPMNDQAFRAFGFLIGVGVSATLWFNARTFRQSTPLVSLVLLGMCPNMIRWGDTMRAYGFGILLSLLTCALLWRFVEKPGAGRFAAAAVAAIASVQVLYFDAVLLLAFCAGAFAVCAHRRAWRDAMLVVVIGGLAAISLVPYASTIREASNWIALIRIPEYTLAWFWTKLVDTVSIRGSFMPAVWAGLLALALVSGVGAFLFPNRFKISNTGREVLLFSLVALLVGLPGTFLFLRTLSYVTQPWYYLTLLALAAVGIDAIFGAFTAKSWRIARLAVVSVLAVATLFPTARDVRTRLTNVDVITAQLQKVARPGDFILVAPWEFGVGFMRYYHGPAQWMTVPPISLRGFHRYDLLMDLMRLPDQTLPARIVTGRVEEALRAGHRVFVAGQLATPRAGVQPIVLPPAPAPRGIWSDGLHERQWSMMVSQFLTQHAAKRTRIVRELGGVSQYESYPVRMFQSWK
jgi:hypothetical protein